MTIEAMKQALEALEGLVDLAHEAGFPCDKAEDAITSLRQAIEHAEKQEPIAFVTGTYGGRFTVKPLNPAMVLSLNMALYTTPQPQQAEKQEQTRSQKLRDAGFTRRPKGWERDAEQAEKQLCVACEGNPQGENIPCAVCGATPQPQREWVGLTEEDINEVLGSDIHDEPSGLLDFVRAIEAKLRSKNT
jgi:hypothetical protein